MLIHTAGAYQDNFSMGLHIISIQPILSHEEYELQEARDLLKVTVA